MEIQAKNGNSAEAYFILIFESLSSSDNSRWPSAEGLQDRRRLNRDVNRPLLMQRHVDRRLQKSALTTNRSLAATLRHFRSGDTSDTLAAVISDRNYSSTLLRSKGIPPKSTLFIIASPEEFARDRLTIRGHLGRMASVSLVTSPNGVAASPETAKETPASYHPRQMAVSVLIWSPRGAPDVKQALPDNPPASETCFNNVLSSGALKGASWLFTRTFDV